MTTAEPQDTLFDFFAHIALPAPAVPADELSRAFAERFGLELALEPVGSQQDQNFLARAATSGEIVGMLKVSNPAFSEAEIDLQNVASVTVAENLPELRVATPVLTAGSRVQGWFETSEGRLHARLIEYVGGATLTGSRYLSADVVGRMGEIAGLVSRALSDVEHSAAARTLQWDLRHAHRVVKTLAAGEEDDEVKELVLGAAREADAVLDEIAAELPSQLGHFDLTDDNIVVPVGGVLPDGIIDFGDVTRSWAVGELAVTLSSILHHAGADPTTTLPAIAAFHRTRPLIDAEVTALWPLVVLRSAVLVLSGRDQSVVDPGNEYAPAALEREWKIFERATSVPLGVMTAQIRSELGIDPDVPPALAVSFARLFETESPVRELQAGTRAPLNNLGAWQSADTLANSALKLIDDEGAGAVVVPFGSVVLPGSPALSPDEPASVATAATVWLRDDASVFAPFDGVVAADDDGIELRGVEYTLRLNGRGLRLVSERPDAGETFAVLPSRRALGIQLRRSGLRVPARVRASLAAGWLTQVVDPSPLLGLPPAKPHRRSDVLKQRERVLAQVQEHYYQDPPQIERGWREHLIDVDGRVYLDMVNNVTSVGHAHPKVAEAAYAQLQLLNTNSRFNYEAVASFATKLAATLPDELDTVFLVNSGSEAADLAIRIAMAATGRRDIVAMRESYHGWTFASDAVSTSIADNPNALTTRPDWVHTVDAANSYRGTHRGSDSWRYAGEAVERIERLTREVKLAGFISESYFGNAGGVALPDGYLEAVYRAVREAGGLAIADEVQVGYGRLGEWFWGFEQQGVVPDIVAVAKSIGNGQPVGAVITSKAIADRYRTQGYFFSSTGGSPVSSVIASTVLDVILEEGLQENARVVGARLKRGLEALADKHALLGAVHGSGLYLGAEFVRDRGTLEPATEETAAICNRLRELGVIMQPTGDHQNVLKIKPPLCVTAESVDYFISALDRVLREGW